MVSVMDGSEVRFSIFVINIIVIIHVVLIVDMGILVTYM